MNFNIGDRVRVKNWDEIDDELKVKNTNCDPRYWTPGKAKNCGLVGTVVDKLYSEAFGLFIYTVKFDGMDIASRSQFDENSIVPISQKQYNVYIDQQGDRVFAELVESDGDTEILIDKKFGRINHEGAYGYAQAASYALLKIYKNLEGGNNNE